MVVEIDFELVDHFNEVASLLGQSHRKDVVLLQHLGLSCELVQSLDEDEEGLIGLEAAQVSIVAVVARILLLVRKNLRIRAPQLIHFLEDLPGEVHGVVEQFGLCEACFDVLPCDDGSELFVDVVFFSDHKAVLDDPLSPEIGNR